MAASTSILDFLAHGNLADRPVSLTLSTRAIGLYFADDTGDTYAWDGSAWQQVNTGGGGSGTTVNNFLSFVGDSGEPGMMGPPGPTGPAGGGGGGGGSFIGLSDVPASFSGAGSKTVRVNSGATALEFVDPAVQARAAWYPPFSVGADDDEFDDGSFTGWTAVNSGSHNPTITETNDVASFLLPGSDAGGELHAYMKAATVSANDYIEVCFTGVGKGQNFNLFSLVMADGTTYGAGVQALFVFDCNETLYLTQAYTNYNTAGTTTTAPTQINVPTFFMRWKYEGSNHFRGYVSPDGVSWADVTGQVSITLTPTKIGFAMTTSGGTNPFAWTVRYFKHSA